MQQIAFSGRETPSVTTSNILNGQAGVTEVGTIVDGSPPLPDTRAYGDLDLDSSVTVTGSGSGPTEVMGAATLQKAAKMSNPQNAELQYDARADDDLKVIVVAGVSGANTAFTVGIAKNGTELDRSRTLGYTASSSEAMAVTSVATVSLTAGDKITAAVENVGGTSDLDVDSMAISV